MVLDYLALVLLILVVLVIFDLSEFNLPAGSNAQVAVYSDHFSHVSIIQKILLRMSSWQNYLFFDH